MDTLDDIDYDVREIMDTLNEKIKDSNLINEKQKKQILGELYLFLNDNGYLKSVDV